MKLPIQAVPVIREDSTARVLRESAGITLSDPSYSNHRFYTCKQGDKYVHYPYKGKVKKSR